MLVRVSSAYQFVLFYLKLIFCRNCCFCSLRSLVLSDIFWIWCWSCRKSFEDFVYWTLVVTTVWRQFLQLRFIRRISFIQAFFCVHGSSVVKETRLRLVERLLVSFNSGFPVFDLFLFAYHFEKYFNWIIFFTAISNICESHDDETSIFYDSICFFRFNLLFIDFISKLSWLFLTCVCR